MLPQDTHPFLLEEKKNVRSWTATSLCYLTGDFRVVGWLPEGTGGESLTKARRNTQEKIFPLAIHWLLLYEDETAGAEAATL